MTKKLQKKYAELIVKVGANVQKGQEVFVYGSADQYEFITLVVEEAYKAGAKQVEVQWSYQPVTRLNYKKMTLKQLSKFPKWKEEKLKYQLEKLPACIHILSDDPDGLKGINYEKMAKSRQAIYPIIKPYREAMDNKYQWTIAAVPSPKWAKKVFPDDRVNVAVKKLWEAIFTTCHLTPDNDAVGAWREHNRKFKQRKEFLTSKRFDYLEYKSSNGTDFRVGLMPESKWSGGDDTSLSGVSYNPNMPTEEIFTAPKKGVAEGRLVSTKPLSYNGVLIENFEFIFKDGKATSWKAEKNGELLDKMLSMDEGAAYLGEVALVPKESGVNKSGILFYETLFDENASCHIAFGKGYSDTVEGFENLTEAQLREKGLNDSMIHVDFMVGSDDLSIVGYKDGVAFEIFKDSTWAF
ncbi:MAG: aminopeptidase [Clostridiales bacterium]|jgi:aminopeptidase|nr:aminopeptidase [Clostridiales bacterium]